MHKHQCSSLAVSEDSRFLLTAGHNAVKVWDYNMQLDINSQVEFMSCIISTIDWSMDYRKSLPLCMSQISNVNEMQSALTQISAINPS